jgi:hypothetical protein
MNQLALIFLSLTYFLLPSLILINEKMLFLTVIFWLCLIVLAVFFQNIVWGIVLNQKSYSAQGNISLKLILNKQKFHNTEFIFKFFSTSYLDRTNRLLCIPSGITVLLIGNSNLWLKISDKELNEYLDSVKSSHKLSVFKTINFWYLFLYLVLVIYLYPLVLLKKYFKKFHDIITVVGNVIIYPLYYFFIKIIESEIEKLSNGKPHEIELDDFDYFNNDWLDFKKNFLRSLVGVQSFVFELDE